MVEVTEYGDCGLLVTFPDADREGRWRAARALQASLLGRRAAGIVDVVASFETAFVTFDPLRTDPDAVRRLILAADLSGGDGAAPRRFRLPVVYGGVRGPDLDRVADELGLTADGVVALHTSAPWTVRLRGSPVAAPMMDGPALPAAVSRNPTPRTTMAAGSVGLSGQQCMVYPVASPGGWRLIGQTPLRLFDLAADGLVAYLPGDTVWFSAIGEHAWDEWSGRSLR